VPCVSVLLVWNAVLEPLETVVRRAAYVLVRVFDDGHHPLGGLTLAKSKCEAVAKSADGALTLEAGEARAEHELYHRDELRRVWAQSEECGNAELLKERVALRGASAHQHDHFVIQLERAGLKPDAAGT